MTIGFWSPLPPRPTGVAPYAAAVLGALRRYATVEVNARRADVHLYHLGNNPIHREIYFQALRQPGVVVLHDAVLHHFLLGVLDRASYIEEFVYNYGEWMRDLAAELWAGRARSAQDPRYFQYPMLRRILETSCAVVVHNPAAARMARAHHAAARVVEIPFPFWEPALPPAAEILRWRSRAGLPSRTVLFGVFGYLRESKRLSSVLRAFRQVRQEGVPAALLVAGQFGSEEFERALAPWMDGVLRAPRLGEREFWKLAAATDVCLNLRYPAAGETSGIAINMMGIGKAVVVSAGEETSRLPDDVCLRVDSGPAERAMLAEYMMWLAQFPDAAGEIGRRAAAYVRARHALERTAQCYWELLASL